MKRTPIYPGLDERWTIVEKTNRRPLGRAVLSRVQEDMAICQGKATEALIMSVIKANTILERRKEKAELKSKIRAGKRLCKLIGAAGLEDSITQELLIKAWEKRMQAKLEPDNLRQAAEGS